MALAVIKATNDMDIVNEIFAIPEIWDAIAPEGEDQFDIPYDPEIVHFLVNDRDGVISFHSFRDGVKIHPAIVPSKRGKIAYEAVEAACVEMHARGYRNIYAEIDRSLRHVIRFAKQLGFRHLASRDRDLLVRRKLDS